MTRGRRQPPPDRDRRLVVIVEDQVPDLATTVRAVRRLGYDALGAGSAELALATIAEAEHPPLAIVADIRLGPGADGIELVHRVHARDGRVPALLVTGAVELPTEATERMLRLGSSVEFVRKLFLHERLHRFLEKADDLAMLGLPDPTEVARASREEAIRVDLTPEEHQLLALELGRFVRKEIAAALGVSEGMVAWRVHVLLRKTGDANVRALRARLLRRRVHQIG